MALAPKSNASYLAIGKAMADVEHENAREVPNHLRDGSYPLSKKLGRGKGYQYPHDFPGHYVEQEYMAIKKQYYLPTEQGYEKVLRERLLMLRRPT